MNAWDELKTSSIKYQNLQTPVVRRQNGIYYTHPNIAYLIMKNLFSNTNLLKEKHIWNLTFLEPCGGLGVFVFSYLRVIHEKVDLTKNQALKLICNIYYCESDTKAIQKYKFLFKKFVKEYFDIDVNDESINIGGPLIYDFSSHTPGNYIPISKYFSKNKFDIIVTNPPYKNLRAEKRQFASMSDFNKVKKIYSQIKNDAVQRFTLSQKGGANLYKYFSEEIISKYSHFKSRIALLIPATILTDKTCSLLRTDIVNKDLVTVGYIPEASYAVDAKQSLAYLTMINQKSELNSDVEIVIHNNHNYSHSYINKNQLVSKAHSDAIAITDSQNYEILDILERSPKIKDFNFISNQRGELDISIDKKFISQKYTPLKLIKGRNIHRYYMDECHTLYVKPTFLSYSKKSRYTQDFRIACQQITNIDKKDRLNFSIVPPKHVLGNSCNFLSISNNQLGIDLFFLLGVLNSNIVNWYFKLFSSNNHVNNYQIDLLPLPAVSLSKAKELSYLVKKMLVHPSQELNKEINQKVINCFKSTTDNIKKMPLQQKRSNKELSRKKIQLSLLTPFEDEISEIANHKRKEIQYAKNNHLLLNNTTYKLSNLDMQMVKSIPEGGNWKNIPKNIVNKSKRLKGISKTGGRTTLYGRLKYNRPSYTITTYFNRPGNGCYIHPTKNRVITTREAARLQGFSDNYYFFGNQRDKLNQIGNAVPPIIGFQFGKQIIKKLHVFKSIELFAGAGGMLTGMKQAGIKNIVANDLDKSACITLKINNPELNVICGDITDELVQQEIILKAKEEKADIISGGPPCQGFSMAGLRKNDDPRNKLFKQFYKIVEEINPKVFIFENVPGLLSYKSGETYIEIKQIFKDLNYQVIGKQILCDEYAVPQKRKRVIIIGVRNDIKIEPNDLFPASLTQKYFLTVWDAISNIENIEHNTLLRTPKSKSLYQSYLQNEISLSQYINEIKIKIGK